MTSARWLRHLTSYPPLDNNKLPSIHEQKSSVGAMGSYDANRPGRGVIHPCVQAIGIQTSAPAVDPAWSVSQLHSLSATVPSCLQKTVLDNHPQMKYPFPPIVFLCKHPSNLMSPCMRETCMYSQCMYPHWKKKWWTKVVILIKYDNIMRSTLMQLTLFDPWVSILWS